MSSEELVWFDCKGSVRVVTDKAIGIQFDPTNNQVDVFVPKSQCERLRLEDGLDPGPEDIEQGDEVVAVELPQWLGEKKQLQQCHGEVKYG